MIAQKRPPGCARPFWPGWYCSGPRWLLLFIIGRRIHE
nr:MAG TPA: hypothetical protein [Caudoviricetes sp.]